MSVCTCVKVFFSFMKILEKPKTPNNGGLRFKRERKKKKSVLRFVYTMRVAGCVYLFPRIYEMNKWLVYLFTFAHIAQLQHANEFHLNNWIRKFLFFFLVICKVKSYSKWIERKKKTDSAGHEQRNKNCTINHIPISGKGPFFFKIQTDLFWTFCSRSFLTLSIDQGARLSWLLSGSSTNIDIVSLCTCTDIHLEIPCSDSNAFYRFIWLARRSLKVSWIFTYENVCMKNWVCGTT